MESSGSRVFFITTGLEDKYFCEREQQDGNGALIEGRGSGKGGRSWQTRVWCWRC